MQETGARWRLGHRPALDGLRGIAILLVLAVHFGVPYADDAGAAGVAAFFALSGFLITALLMEERHRNADALRRFYVRRAARLGPALIAAVVLAVAAQLIVAGSVPDWSLVLGALTWTSNFVMMHAGWHQWAETPLSQAWSLAVEEQFYLVWPVLLFGLLRIQRVLRLLLVLLMIASSVSVATSVSTAHRYLLLDSRASQLLIGALLAMCLAGRARVVGPPRWVGSGLLLALVVWPVAWKLSPPLSLLFGEIAALLAAGVVWCVVTHGVTVLEMRPLRWLGERSYGLYLYHLALLYLADALFGASAGVIALVLSIGVSALSYRWLEQPIRRRYRRSAVVPAGQLAAAA